MSTLRICHCDDGGKVGNHYWDAETGKPVVAPSTTQFTRSALCPEHCGFKVGDIVAVEPHGDCPTHYCRIATRSR
jgi:hypothetical protein